MAGFIWEVGTVPADTHFLSTGSSAICLECIAIYNTSFVSFIKRRHVQCMGCSMLIGNFYLLGVPELFLNFAGYYSLGLNIKKN